MTELRNITKTDIEEFKKMFGANHFAMTMKVLSSRFAFLHQVIETSPGKEIMEDDLVRHEELVMKLYNDAISPAEKAELNYLKTRITKIGTRILEYKRKENEVMKKVRKGGQNV